jgi:putative Mn2+ efflux pump MntP
MPVVGVLLGGVGAGIVQSGSRLIAAAVLVALGLWALFSDREGDEERRAAALARARGWAVFGLGLSISLDELAIGAGFGLLRVPAAPAIALIAVQALVAGQVGLLVGARAGEAVRRRSEKLAGLVLIAIGAGLALLPLR